MRHSAQAMPAFSGPARSGRTSTAGSRDRRRSGGPSGRRAAPRDRRIRCPRRHRPDNNRRDRGSWRYGRRRGGRRGDDRSALRAPVCAMRRDPSSSGPRRRSSTHLRAARRHGGYRAREKACAARGRPSRRTESMFRLSRSRQSPWYRFRNWRMPPANATRIRRPHTMSPPWQNPRTCHRELVMPDNALPYDVIVVGGGVNGAGVARDAAGAARGCCCSRRATWHRGPRRRRPS